MTHSYNSLGLLVTKLQVLAKEIYFAENKIQALNSV